MPVDQWLRSVTSRMGVLIYLGRYFQTLLRASFGKHSIVSIVRTRIQVPPPARGDAERSSATRRGNSHFSLLSAGNS
jgi:hypothetical protein